MNEAELVEVALAILAEVSRDLRRGRCGPDCTGARQEEQELPPTPNEAPGSTANRDGGSDHGPALPCPPGAGADAERTDGENSEDDVLKYVREIFFS
uniref:Uncharacterized protein n=1 Tax=Taeniopygia guttata TaxID=59729 RepID=A0A674H7Q1_TAEGU